MEIAFRSVAEERPGTKWRALFDELWPAYRQWYMSDGLEQRATYMVCLESLERHMPRIIPLYEELCELAGGGDLPARFLSLWRPPAYISGCSQVVWLGERPLCEPG